VLAVTPRPPRYGSDRIRTGTHSPDKRALCSLSYAPNSAAGIRTQDLELMRLARTAPPLPRDLAGRTRTCDLRFPRPVGCQTPLRPVEEPPAGLEPAPSGLRIRRHPVSTTGARKAPAAGIEPAISRVTTARLTDSTTPERTEATGLEPVRRGPALRRSKALPYRSAMPPEGRRGNRTPKALPDPPVFETGYRACGSPSKVAPAGFEPATSRLRVGCSAD
jgi:hypothetical protein